MARQMIERCTHCHRPIYWGDRYITLILHYWTVDDDGEVHPRDDARLHLHPICFVQITCHALLELFRLKESPLADELKKLIS